MFLDLSSDTPVLCVFITQNFLIHWYREMTSMSTLLSLYIVATECASVLTYLLLRSSCSLALDVNISRVA
jgi:hypothetical protein